jgi:ADP-dependent NAD(P)H-hydrate dehydratase / NAD(P)H-hydrate epimerase
VIPIVSPAEMAAIDAAAPEPVEVLIGRAGAATAAAALDLLGGGYGRRVTVIAGKGNNGNDGRAAAQRLRRRGVRATVLDAADLPEVLPAADLVIDAAYGTGFSGSWPVPDVGDVRVLAVDIPSGVDGLTGTTGAGGPGALSAVRTVTFAALKPGLVLEPGASLAGEVQVADIGLDTSSARAHLLEPGDLSALVPHAAPETHKWRRAVWVIGGREGMEGAAVLTARAALRAGAGYVRWSAPGGTPPLVGPPEVVRTGLDAQGWVDDVLAGAERFSAIAVGNGLGTDAADADQVRRLVAEAAVPVVVDADALTLLGDRAGEVTGASTILTPHDGEFARLAGSAPGPDRLEAARALAADLGCVVVLKGPATVVAEPGGSVVVSRLGDQRLATLGTGDVLAGLVAACAAQGATAFDAAVAGVGLHGLAGRLGWRRGLVAGDLCDLVPRVLDAVLHPQPPTAPL